jgi:hypothetical protein
MAKRHEDSKEVGASRREWAAPQVRRMAAGSAEDGYGPSPDGGLPS